jgi:NADH dehydrogenase
MPEAVILRPSIVFGPEDEFFNRFAAMAQLAPVLPLIGGGRTRFQPVYVGDVADAAIAGLENRAARGQTYELGGPEVKTFRELMELMYEITGRRRPFLNIPFGLAEFMGHFMQHLPGAPITADQVLQLEQDNVVTGEHPGLADLGITPTALRVVLPGYLDRFRPGGRFARSRSV